MVRELSQGKKDNEQNYRNTTSDNILKVKQMSYCKECFEKQKVIDRLQDEIKRLKGLIKYQERTAKEGVFGSSTPSSKKLFKKNADEETRGKKGGAVNGHIGHGRKSINKSDADKVLGINVLEICPDCGGKVMPMVSSKPTDRGRTVIDIQPVKLEKIYYDVSSGKCEKCGRIYRGKVPGVLPKSLFGNELISHIAVQHYIYGTTLGKLESQFGIGIGSIVNILHRLSKIFKDLPDKLIQDYRQAFVKHADETGWRDDGRSGYGWLFCTEDTSIFRFRDSRSSKVPMEIFGNKQLPGRLIVDRYNGYNKLPVILQYCYAHLLRTLEDIEKDFPDILEVRQFVSTLAPLLSQAMRLRSQKIPDEEFYKEAKLIKKKILDAVNSQANHSSIQQFQDIFRNNAGRMYHWSDDRRVPADNNMAERDLRSTVIARKVSFGSQSEEGAKTREILMTVLFTLKKRCDNYAARFKSVLDAFANNPNSNLYELLFALPKR